MNGVQKQLLGTGCFCSFGLYVERMFLYRNRMNWLNIISQPADTIENRPVFAR
jgi:hypothetical protein